MTMKQEILTAVFVHRGVTNNGVYLVRRKVNQTHLRGYTTFPSGKILSEPQALLDECKRKFPGVEPRMIAALCKIAEKKLGVQFMDAWDADIVAGVRYIGHDNGFDFPPYDWTNHYLLVELNKRIPFKAVGKELAYGSWMPPSTAMREFDGGGLLMEPSTQNLLAIMRYDLTNESGEDFSFRVDHETEVPWFQPFPGIVQLVPRACTFPPISRTNSFIVGDPGERRFLIDPSPTGENEYQKFLNTLRRFQWTDILITHHHPDHTEQIARLLTEIPTPVTIHQEAYRIITGKHGKDCLKGLDIRFASDGDEITHWQGQPVRTYHLPGHSRDQLGLAPDNMAWFMAGDLVLDKGTVVIPKEEGDMIEYVASLQRIIDLDPAVIFPSHGIGQGSPQSLIEALAHRSFRERQVLAYYKKGLTPEQMVDYIYLDLHPFIRPFALENVLSHLDKLEQEGKLASCGSQDTPDYGD